MNGKRMNSQRSTKETKAQPNKDTAESGKFKCAVKRLLKLETCKMTFQHVSGSLRESRLGCPRIARVTSSEELGTRSKNTSRGIAWLGYNAYIGDSLSNLDILVFQLILDAKVIFLRLYVGEGRGLGLRKCASFGGIGGVPHLGVGGVPRFMIVLKWYCDENRIFPIEAILKHKQVVYMRRKMPFTFLQYLSSFQRYSSF